MVAGIWRISAGLRGAWWGADFGSRLNGLSVENVGIGSILLFGREKRAPFIFRSTCAFVSKIGVFLECSKVVSACMDRSKNFSKFSLFALGRLRIWLIFRQQKRLPKEIKEQKSKCKNVEARCAGGIFLDSWQKLVRIMAIQLEAGHV